MLSCVNAVVELEMNENTEAAIQSVGIVTCDRPGSLRRAVASYLAHHERHGRRVPILVFDDSSTPETEKANREALLEWAACPCVDLYYGCRSDRARYARELSALSGVPSDIVDFALLGLGDMKPSTGANRNAHLLATVGELAYCADDDTVCQVGVAGGSHVDAPPCLGEANWDYWFFADRPAAMAAVEFVDHDLLKAHERLLGRALPSRLSGGSCGQSSPIPGLQGSEEDGDESSAAHVGVTLNGLVGDSCWGAPFGFAGGPVGCLLQEGTTRARLMESESNYRLGCMSREVVCSVSQPTISRPQPFGTCFWGLDNREEQPPFVPVGRSQDLVFGAILARCYPNTRIGYIPLVSVHAPEFARRFWPQEVHRTASGVTLANVIIECIRSASAVEDSTSDEGRLRTMGQHLVELGSLPGRHFRGHLREVLSRSYRGYHALMEQWLQRYRGKPEYWASDVQRYMGLLAAALERPDFFVPIELAAHRGVATACALTQELVLNYGRLLEGWPRMTAAARRLKSQGMIPLRSVQSGESSA